MSLYSLDEQCEVVLLLGSINQSKVTKQLIVVCCCGLLMKLSISIGHLMILTVHNGTNMLRYVIFTVVEETRDF